MTAPVQPVSERRSIYAPVIIREGVNNIMGKPEFDFMATVDPFQHRYYVVKSLIKPDLFPKHVDPERDCRECNSVGHEARQCYFRGIYRLGQLDMPVSLINSPRFRMEEELRCMHDWFQYYKNRSEIVEMENDRLMRSIDKVKREGQFEINFQAGLAFFYINEFNKAQLDYLNECARVKSDMASQTEYVNVDDNSKTHHNNELATQVLQLTEELDVMKIKNGNLISDNVELKLQIEKDYITSSKFYELQVCNNHLEQKLAEVERKIKNREEIIENFEYKKNELEDENKGFKRSLEKLFNLQSRLNNDFKITSFDILFSELNRLQQYEKITNANLLMDQILITKIENEEVKYQAVPLQSACDGDHGMCISPVLYTPADFENSCSDKPIEIQSKRDEESKNFEMQDLLEKNKSRGQENVLWFDCEENLLT